MAIELSESDSALAFDRFLLITGSVHAHSQECDAVCAFAVTQATL
jgi:hypothetical protein